MWRPAPGWIVAVAPLPGGEPDGDIAYRHQLAFAEEAGVLPGRSGKDPAVRFSEISELADSNPDRLASLPGDFGFIRFRTGGGATVVRSCGGLVPFYLKQSGHRFVIATRLGDFVRYLPDEPRLDPLVNAMTLLIEKLTRDLDPEDGNLLTLSGGVDSSSLAALAAGVVQRKV